MDGYSYYIRLKDELTAQLKMAKTHVSDFHRKMLQSNSVAARAYRKSRVAVYRLNQAQQNLNNSIRQFGGLMGRLGIAFALTTAIHSAVKLGVEYEQTRLKYQTFLQDVQKGNAMMARIDNFANLTPYSNKVLHDSTSMLLQYGLEAQKVEGYIKDIGAVSAGSADKMHRISLAFGQAMSLGRLQGQDWKQMVEAGFNPLEQMSKDTGKTIAELQNMMYKGQISTDLLAQAFHNASKPDGRFYGILEKMSKTVGGKWSTFMGQLQNYVAKFMLKLRPIFSDLLDTGIAMLEMFKDLYHMFIDLDPAVKNTTLSVLALVAGWKIFNMVLKANLILRIISIILLLSSVIANARKPMDEWSDAWKANFKIIRLYTEWFINGIVNFVSDIGYYLNLGWLHFKNFNQKLVGGVMNAGRAIREAAKLNFDQAKKELTAPIKTTASVEINNMRQKYQNRLKGRDARNKVIDEQLAAARKMKEAAAGNSVVDQLKSQLAALNGNGSGSGSGSSIEDVVTGGRRALIVNVSFNKEIANVTNNITDGVQQAENFVDTVLEGITRRIAGAVRTAAQ